MHLPPIWHGGEQSRAKLYYDDIMPGAIDDA